MALKAGRVGVAPSSVDSNGNVIGASVELTTEEITLEAVAPHTEDKGSLYQLFSASTFDVTIGDNSEMIICAANNKEIERYSAVFFVPKCYKFVINATESEVIGLRTYFK